MGFVGTEEMETRLSRIDINLLVSLKVLLEECNVTRAAERLHLTQPTVSRSLQRLRDMLDDPLFTRSAHGLVPTPKAKALKQPLLDVLSNLDSMVFPNEFDPATAEDSIRICMAPEVSCAIVPPLIERIRDNAPKIKIFTQHSLRNYKEQLGVGYMDFAIVNKFQPEHDFYFQPISSRPFVCWMRKIHPLAKKKRLTIRDLASVEEVSYYASQLYEAEANDYDALLGQAGVKFKQTILTTTDLVTTLDVLCRRDALAIMSPHIRAFKLVEDHLTYKTVSKKISDISKSMETLYLVQHFRTSYSPLHLLIKKSITAIAESLD